MCSASSHAATCAAWASASEYTATVRTPRRRAVAATRQAISPRLAIRILLNMGPSELLRGFPNHVVVHRVEPAALAAAALAQAERAADRPVARGPARRTLRADGKCARQLGFEKAPIGALAGVLRRRHLGHVVEARVVAGGRPQHQTAGREADAREISLDQGHPTVHVVADAAVAIAADGRQGVHLGLAAALGE